MSESVATTESVVMPTPPKTKRRKASELDQLGSSPASVSYNFCVWAHSVPLVAIICGKELGNS